MNSIGEKIKSIRINKGMTLEEFGAVVLDANKSLVSKWERGLIVPNSARLKKIAELGNVSVTYLLKENESDRINTLQKQLLSLKGKKMDYDIYSSTIAIELSKSNLSEESRLQGEKILKDTELAIEKLDNAIREMQSYIFALESLEKETNASEELNMKFGGFGNPDEVPIEEIKRTLENNGLTINDATPQKIALESIFNETQELTLNGKTLSVKDKQKALQLLKIALS